MNGDDSGNGHDYGWQEMPDFSAMSDARLTLQEALVDENIRWSEEGGDLLLATEYRQQMRALQAERKRRNGGSNSFLSLKGDIGKEKNLRPLSSSELLNREMTPILYILGDYIPKGILALLVAFMKIGKTTLAYRLAVAIAQGSPFLERKTKQGPVLILALEEHARDVERRLRRFGITENDPLYVHVGPLQNSPETIQKLRNFIIEKKICLLIVDSLCRFWNVQDENNNAEVIREVSPLLDMARETDAAVLLIHHERKSGGEDGRNIRGGSALFGLVDQALFLDRRPGEVSNKRILKALGRYEDTPPELVIEFIDDNYQVLGTVEEFSQAQTREKVKAALTEDPADIKTIAERADVTEKAARTTLEALRDNSEAVRTGKGVKRDPYLYSLLSQSFLIGKETKLTKLDGVSKEALNVFGVSSGNDEGGKKGTEKHRGSDPRVANAKF